MSDKIRQFDSMPYSIQINAPPNGAPVPHVVLPTDGEYGGPSLEGVLVECVLTYTNPAGGPFSNGQLPPEDPVNQTWNRQFNNVPQTQQGQLSSLTAFLFDPSGQTLLAQSTTIAVQIT